MAKSKAAKAAGAAAAARSSPYVQRVVEDEDLRDNLRTAFESARDAYTRLSNGKAPHKALMDDKKLQRSLQEAATSLKDASQALREGPKKRRGGFGRKLMILLIGGGIALAVSEGLRNKVLDALFGKEEEFDYTSTTTAPPPPTTAGTPAS